MWPEVGGIVTALSYAGSNIYVRLGLKGSNPLTGAITTLSVNCALLWVLSFIFVPWSAYHLGLVWIFIVDGFMTQASGRLLKYNAIGRLGAARAGAIMGSTPLFSVLFATVLFGEKITPLLILGVVLVVLGISVLSTEEGGGGKGKKARFRDIMFPLGASLLFGLSPNLRKWGLDALSYPLLGAAVTSSTSITTLLILSSILERGKRLTMDNRSLRYFLMAGLFTVVALPIYYYALQAGQVVVVGPLANTSGFFTVLMVHFMLRKSEKVTFKIWAGALAVIAGSTAIILH